MALQTKIKNILFAISVFSVLWWVSSCQKEKEEQTTKKVDTIAKDTTIADTVTVPSFNNRQVLSYGVCCYVPTPDSQDYKNDALHPSVVYISSGFGGHKWWMVQSPYYACRGPIENPMLYYAEETADGSAPKTWIPALNHPVVGPPSQGYNSDPDLFYENVKLWLFWRENFTLDSRNNHYERAIFVIPSTDGETGKL